MGLVRAFFLLWDSDSHSRPWEGRFQTEAGQTYRFQKQHSGAAGVQWPGGATSRN